MITVRDTLIYVGRVREFSPRDWLVYIAWVGLMCGLLFCTAGFMTVGYLGGVEYPSYAWWVPIGTFIFVGAISFDTIGHRTVYAEALKNGENLVHHITIFAGISSCVILCLAYLNPDFWRIPAWVMTALTVFYSMIDEWMHWLRYMKGNSDPVEMWSHFFIFVGHLIMMAGWLYWFEMGYPGVAETLAVLPV